ncbi:MAG: phage replisome organizer N-terminal domain-containing protein, partial [Eubacteriales bacterium]|nr:phage replisome organizer N-terminal domain-containing protein [Eubacteriales bacterium]
MDAKSKRRGTGNYNPTGRRWWLKLQFDFFADKRVRALRRRFGDLSVILYQKMLLKSLANNSSMRFEGLEATFEEEIAVDIMEDDAEKVQLICQVIDFLIQYGLIIQREDESYFFPQAAEMSGSECSSAERMRNKRTRDKEASQGSDCGDCEPLQNDNSASQCNDLSQCNTIPLQRYHIQSKNKNNSTATDIAIARAISVEQEQEKEKSADENFVFVSVPADRGAADAAKAAPRPGADVLFTLHQLRDIGQKNDINLSG